MLCRGLYACAEDCVMHVHAIKHHFVDNQGSYACAEGFVMHVHAIKHHFVDNQGPYACAEGFVMYLLPWKHQFLQLSGIQTELPAYNFGPWVGCCSMKLGCYYSF